MIAVDDLKNNLLMNNIYRHEDYKILSHMETTSSENDLEYFFLNLQFFYLDCSYA